jgi:hypothetical protein
MHGEMRTLNLASTDLKRKHYMADLVIDGHNTEINLKTRGML